MKTKHTHIYDLKLRSKKMRFCVCGRFKFVNLKPSDIIVGISVEQNATKQNS